MRTLSTTLTPTLVFVAASALGLACELPEYQSAALQAHEALEFELPDEGPMQDQELAVPPDLGASDVLPTALADFDPQDNQACVDCHPAAAETWQGSLHQRAWVEPAFQTSYSREPLEFCRTCHAPRANPELEPPPHLAKLGVDCVSCHVRDELVHTGPASASSGPAPHALARSEDFGEASCASCHQFEFPRKAHRAPGTLMQKTMREHERSEWSELTCSDCHFPARDDGLGRDHGMAVSRDPDLLRRSLSAAVTRVDADTLRFELSPIGVGHRFPTGDLFRRLELRVEARDASGAVVEIERRYLARHFAQEVDGHGYIGEARDDRLAGPTRIELGLERGSEASELYWRVSYQRVDSRDHAHPERSKLAGEVVLAQGVL